MQKKDIKGGNVESKSCSSKLQEMLLVQDSFMTTQKQEALVKFEEARWWYKGDLLWKGHTVFCCCKNFKNSCNHTIYYCFLFPQRHYNPSQTAK